MTLRLPISNEGRRIALTLLCAASLVLSHQEGRACGVSWNPPPLEYNYADAQGVFKYWVKMCSLELEKNLPINLNIGFSPASQYTSPQLGRGWSFALFNSRIEQIDENEFRLYQPDGSESLLSRNKEIPNVLVGDGWTAEIQNKTITCKASCGWELSFEEGKIKQLKSPSGKSYDITTQNGISTMQCNGAPLIELKEIGTKDQGKSLKLTVNKEEFLLKIDPRPIIENINGIPLVGKMVSSLSRIDYPDGSVKNFDFSVDEHLIPTLKTGEHSFVWDAKSYVLNQDGEERYALTNFYGIQCMKTTRGDGKTELFGRDLEKGVFLSSSFGEAVTVTESFTSGELLRGKPRRIIQLNLDGHQIILQQFSYNERGDISRVVINNPVTHSSTFYTMNMDAQAAYDLLSHTILWEKHFDKDGHIQKFHFGQKSYQFHYDKASAFVSISTGDNMHQTVLLPVVKLNNLLSQLQQ